jgi:hypothetical protein
MIPPWIMEAAPEQTASSMDRREPTLSRMIFLRVINLV